MIDGFLPERPQGQYGERPGSEEWVGAIAVEFRGDMVVTDRRTGEIVLPASKSRFFSPHFWRNSATQLFVPYFKIHGSLNWVYNESILVRKFGKSWPRRRTVLKTGVPRGLLRRTGVA